MKYVTSMLLLVALAVAGCQVANQNGEPNSPNESVFCTEDAKLCPDGSSVGRVPPTCEFAPCPEPQDGELKFEVDRKVIGQSADECSRIRYTCAPGYESYDDGNTCGCVMYGYNITAEMRQAEVCTLQYDPVCGWFNESVQCIAYPCAQTFGNSCTAGTDPQVAYYTKGECPLPTEGVPNGKVDEDALLTFSYRPMQCEETPWEKWSQEPTVQLPVDISEQELIVSYYGSKEIEVTAVTRIDTDEAVCLACGVCPKGYNLTLVARAGDKFTLTEDGWVTTSDKPSDNKVNCTNPRPEACTRELSPVCGYTQDGSGSEYGNKCVACSDDNVSYYIPGECSEDDVVRKYVSRDPDECAATLFQCVEGRQPFFDDTGCGCELK